MRTKNTLTQTPRLEQREAQQHRIPHTRPNRRSNAHVDDDALHQNCAEVAEDSDGRLIRIPMIRIAIGVVMGWAMLTTACTA